MTVERTGAMTRTMATMLSTLLAFAGLQTSIRFDALAQQPKALRVASEQTVSGFPFPESVGCDAQAQVLYVSQFVSALKAVEKDGKGRISKVSLTGKIMEEQFLPASGEVLNKPKGIWVEGGRKVELTGAKFANDPAVMNNVLYVSDNRGDEVFRVEPADFLDTKTDPKVTRVASGKSVNPNGLYPGRDDALLMVGFMPEQDRGIYALSAGGEVKPLSKDLGRLDGVYQMSDATLLVTDWKSGSLLRWSPTGEVQTLARDFKGPADFCVMPEGSGRVLVVVPDLVKSELRLIHLAP